MILVEVILTIALIFAIARLIATYLPSLSNAKLSFASAIFILTPCVVFYSLSTIDSVKNFTLITGFVFFILVALAPFYALIPLIIGVKSLMKEKEIFYSFSGVILNALIIAISLYFYREFFYAIGHVPVGIGG